MTLFRFPEDRVPVALFALYFAADLAVLALAESWWLPVVWFLAGIIPKGWISSWNHHHQHLSFFRPAWANRLLEVMFGFQTGVTSHAWFLHHVVGHHKNYLDQTQDESAWRRADGSTMGELEYSFDVAATAYVRAWRVGARYPSHRRVFLVMGLVHLALLGTAFVLRPYNAFFVLFLPSVVSLFVTAWATYFHHADLDTDDHLKASYNILHRGYNLATGNLGYHTAHHSRPGLHWSRLPEFHAEIEAGIPAHLYRVPGVPFRWTGTEAVTDREHARESA
jgi:fatty acid desaturase